MSLTLEAITEILLSDSTSALELKITLSDYRKLLLKATSLDVNRAEHRTDIQLENGIAIGLSWAASCLDDSIRTRKFIRGTKLAIDQKLKESRNVDFNFPRPVHLLYAGIGPFATLILPLLYHYSEQELLVTLLDVNPASAENVSKLIKHFGFENHVIEIRCADATETIFQDAEKFDILLSETMQHTLQSELQVVICAHLLNQLSKEAILILQSIDLELVSLSTHHPTQEPPERIGEIMKVDANFLRVQGQIDVDWRYEKQFKLPDLNQSENAILAISTAIHVFGNEVIEWNESGLTVPKFLAPMRDFENNSSIDLRYVIDPEPGFKLRCSVAGEWQDSKEVN